MVPKRVEDRLGVRVPVQRRLWEHRVEEDERGERERERVDQAGPERQRPGRARVPGDAGERDRQQDLLPGGDRGERRSLHPEGEEAGHDGVVERQSDDERVDRVHRPPPDGDTARRQRRGVDDERESRHEP